MTQDGALRLHGVTVALGGTPLIAGLELAVARKSVV